MEHFPESFIITHGKFSCRGEIVKAGQTNLVRFIYICLIKIRFTWIGLSVTFPIILGIGNPVNSHIVIFRIPVTVVVDTIIPFFVNQRISGSKIVDIIDIGPGIDLIK